MASGVTSQAIQPQIVYVQQPATRSYENYNTKVARGFGITRIITGSLIVLLQIAAIVLVANYGVWGYGNVAGVGIWGGALVSRNVLV